MNGIDVDTKIVKSAANLAFVTNYKGLRGVLILEAANSKDLAEAENRWLAVVNADMMALGAIAANISGKLPDRFVAEAFGLYDKFKTEIVTQIEKTRFESFENDGGETVVMVNWDSTPSAITEKTARPVLEHIKEEKLSRMVQKLAQFSAECGFVIFGSGLIALDDTISSPFSSGDEYSEKRLAIDMSKRRLPTRPNPPNPR